SCIPVSSIPSFLLNPPPRRGPPLLSAAGAPPRRARRLHPHPPLRPPRQSPPHRGARSLSCALDPTPPPPHVTESVRDLLLRVTGVDIERCPVCRQGVLQLVERLAPAPVNWDTS